MSATEAITGRQAALMALAQAGVHVTSTDLNQIHRHSQPLFERMREGRPAVVVVSAGAAQSLDVMSLRWLFPGGITPLLLSPSHAAECAELAQVAASAAALLAAPVFLLLEESVGQAACAADQAPPAFRLTFDEPAPVHGMSLSSGDAELARLEARLSRPPRGFPAAVREIGAREGGVPWFVVCYGATASAAREAAETARAQGQNVDLLRLRMLWPVPEREILSAASGARQVLVAERNLGQYSLEIKRLLPGLPVIAAGGLTVSAETILHSLRRTPRCC